MNTSRFTEEHIIAILRQSEAEASISSLSAEHGVSKTMLAQWRARYNTAAVRQKNHSVKDLAGMPHQPGGSPVPLSDMRVTDPDS